jgi:cell division protein FtsQ
MDGGKRLAQSLTWIMQLRARSPAGAAVKVQQMLLSEQLSHSRRQRIARFLWVRLLRFRLPRGVGATAAVLIIAASAGYGLVKGEHITTIAETFQDLRDRAGNAAGFKIASLGITGNQHVGREAALAMAGVTDRTSLLFLDVDDTRERLKANPWILEATVLKLLPGDLQINITERQPFALWQKDGRVSVIAEDGTILESHVPAEFVKLPLVVGRGAGARAKRFLALLDQFPDIRDQMRGAILVGERRWNLRLRNGLDIRLPESDVARALERLAEMDRKVKLISRDIVAIDMRLPDRVTIRLSPAAAQARAEAIKEKDKKSKKKGGDA